ncbi:MAG TPA: hypothetical protein VNT76_23310, partial [Candidatus Binatus sp.]|nr:hypothetical protein [Candidatus Binatus sp.]
MSFGLLPSLSGTRILPGSFGNIVNRAFGVGPPVGGGYTTGGVSFNGIDTMLDLAALAASNSPFLSFSYWYQYPGNMAAPIWAIDPAGDDFMQDFGTVGPTPFVADEPFAGNRLEFDLTGSPAFNVWHGAQICMNVNHAAGARPHSVWVDDVNMTNDVFDDGIAFTLTPNGFRMTIGSDTFGSFLAGNIADFWWGQGQFIDFSILALRRKFI